MPASSNISRLILDLQTEAAQLKANRLTESVKKLHKTLEQMSSWAMLDNSLPHIFQEAQEALQKLEEKRRGSDKSYKKAQKEYIDNTTKIVNALQKNITEIERKGKIESQEAKRVEHSRKAAIEQAKQEYRLRQTLYRQQMQAGAQRAMAIEREIKLTNELSRRTIAARKEAYKATTGQMFVTGEFDERKAKLALKRYVNAEIAESRRLKNLGVITRGEQIDRNRAARLRGAEEEARILARIESERTKREEKETARRKQLREQELRTRTIATRERLALDKKLEQSDAAIIRMLTMRARRVDKLSEEEKKIIRLIHIRHTENKKLTKEEEQLLAVSKRFQSSADKSRAAFLRLTGGLGKAWAAMSRVRNMMLLATFSSRFMIHGISRSIRAYTDYEKSIRGTVSIGEKFGVTAQQVQAAVSHLTEDGIFKLTDATKALRNLLSTGIGLQQAMKTLDALRDSAAFNRQGMLEYGQAIVGATDGIKNMISRMVDNAGVTKNLSNILKEQAAILGVNTAALSERQKMMLITKGIIKEAARFEGDAARLAGTTSGKMEQLAVSINRVAREMGRVITQSGPFQDALILMSNIFNELSAMGKTPQEHTLDLAVKYNLPNDYLKRTQWESGRQAITQLMGRTLRHETSGLYPRMFGNTSSILAPPKDLGVALSEYQHGNKYLARLNKMREDAIRDLNSTNGNQEKVNQRLNKLLHERMQIEKTINDEMHKFMLMHEGDFKAIEKQSQTVRLIIQQMQLGDQAIRESIRANGGIVGQQSNGILNSTALSTQTKQMEIIYRKIIGDATGANMESIKKQLDPIFSALQTAGAKLSIDYSKLAQSGFISLKELPPKFGPNYVTTNKTSDLGNTQYLNPQTNPYLSNPFYYSPTSGGRSRSNVPMDIYKQAQDIISATNIKSQMTASKADVKRALQEAQLNFDKNVTSLLTQSILGHYQNASEILKTSNITDAQKRIITPEQAKKLRDTGISAIQKFYSAQIESLRNKYGATIGGEFKLLDERNEGIFKAQMEALRRNMQHDIDAFTLNLTKQTNSSIINRINMLLGFEKTGIQEQINNLSRPAISKQGLSQLAIATGNTIQASIDKAQENAIALAKMRYANDPAAQENAIRQARQAGESMSRSLWGALSQGVQSAASALAQGGNYLPIGLQQKVAMSAMKAQHANTLAQARSQVGKTMTQAQYNALEAALRGKEGYQRLQDTFMANNAVQGVTGGMTQLPLGYQSQLAKKKAGDTFQERIANINRLRNTGALGQGQTAAEQYKTLMDAAQAQYEANMREAKFIPLNQHIQDAKQISDAFVSSFANIANAAKSMGKNIDTAFNRVNTTMSGVFQAAQGVQSVMSGKPMGVITGGFQILGGVANVIGGIKGSGESEEGTAARRARTYGQTINRGPTQYTIAPSLVIENGGDVFVGEDGIEAAGKRLGSMVAESMEYGEISR